MSQAWRVRHLRDKSVIRRFLDRDRVFGAYLLGDLDEPHWGYCKFFGAYPGGVDQPKAMVLRYNGFAIPILVVLGQPEGVAAILPTTLDGQHVYYTASEMLFPLVQHYYETPSARHMWRMTLKSTLVLPDGLERTRPLGLPENLPQLEDIFSHERQAEGNHFNPDQVKDGAFSGIFEAGQLISVAGTHLVSEHERVAAIGNVYTRPASRGRGYATLCTAATTKALLTRGIQTIVLNVAQSNRGAIHIYEKLGFVRHTPFWEGLGHQHAIPPEEIVE